MYFLQQAKLDKARQDLANLDQKARDQRQRVQRAEENVVKAEAELENLPPPPEGHEEKKRALQAQWRDMDMQVTSWTSAAYVGASLMCFAKIRLDCMPRHSCASLAALFSVNTAVLQHKRRHVP